MKKLVIALGVWIFPSALAAGPVQFAVNRDSSFIAMRTGKSGFLTFFGVGHNHGIVATDWSADMCADPTDLSRARAAVSISARALRIDTPTARKLAGLSPGEGPGADTVKELQNKMLSAKYLAASEHPDIRFQSTSVERQGQDSLLLRGDFTMRGRVRPISAPVRVRHSAKEFVFSGHFQVRQTSFGIEPESIAGVVKVKDEVDILFQFAATPTTTGCRTDLH